MVLGSQTLSCRQRVCFHASTSHDSTLRKSCRDFASAKFPRQRQPLSRSVAAAAAAIDGNGPFDYVREELRDQLVGDKQGYENIKVDYTVTYPTNGGNAAKGLLSPVIVFFSGFLLSVKFYEYYCQRLASWGYTVFQYDFGKKELHDDDEIKWFDHVIRYAREHVKPENIPKVDWDRVATAGHSRGGKLATLMRMRYSPTVTSTFPKVSTAFLIDPVNGANEGAIPATNGYPEAVEQLKSEKPKLDIAVIGHHGRPECGIVPPKYDYTTFWGGTDPRRSGPLAHSWYAEMLHAGHMSFCERPGFLITGHLLQRHGWRATSGILRNLLFGRNIKEVVQPTSTLLATWMRLKMPISAITPCEEKEIIAELRTWLDQEVQGRIVKEDPDDKIVI